MPKIHMPAELAEVIALHREMFGDAKMMADEPQDGSQEPVEGSAANDTKETPAGPQGDDEPLGEGGLKALRATRDENRQMKARIKSLEEQVGTIEAIKNTLNPQPNSKPEAVPDWFRPFADRLEQSERARAESAREALINRVARKHNLTRDEDVEILAAIASEDAMDKVAKRLATSHIEPDPGQGAGRDSSTGQMSGKDIAAKFGIKI